MNPIDTTAPAGAFPPADTGTTAQDTGSQIMGRDDFLRLLVTQLNNQDPLNPMNGQEFAAQLAQFSSVEQLLNINESLTAQGEMTGLLAQNINNGVATGLIGKEVVALGDQIGLSGSGTVPISFELPNAASDVTVTIQDASGNLVRTINLGSKGAGEHEVEWDGEATAGGRLPEGVYSLAINGTDADGNTVTAETAMRGTVDRVSFGPEGILLWMGDVSVTLSAVKSVQQQD
jgi:flagellar basal-body rod modification protein FlgD